MTILEVSEIILRSFAAFTILFIGARILGKQTISQMTIFDFIAAITLGGITANLASNTKIAVHHPVISFSTFVLIIFTMAIISLRNKRGRKLFAGDPTVVIENGKILESNMKKMRYTLDYLNQQLRQKDVFDIGTIQFALVETNGNLSVLKKPEYRTPINKDFSIHSNSQERLPIELIMDGTIINKNLEDNNLSHRWLYSELDKRKVQPKDVVYAVLAPNNKVYLDTYRDQIDSPVDRE
jgi:uncharacterized membrane protein YcaP (DUF421 family)